MPDKEHFKPEEIIEAIEVAEGSLTNAAKLLGCTYQTICNYRDRYPEIKMKIDEMDEMDIDFTESMLKQNIRAGKEASIFFHLKTKGRHRGYIENVEQYLKLLESKIETNININFEASKSIDKNLQRALITLNQMHGSELKQALYALGIIDKPKSDRNMNPEDIKKIQEIAYDLIS